MATLEELQKRRDEIIKRRESLVTRVTTSAGRTVQYDPTHSDAALREIDRQIAAIQNTTNTRHVRVRSEKGL